VNKQLKEYIKALDGIHLKDGLRHVMSISELGNVFLQDRKPWELITKDKDRCGTVVAVALNLVKLLCTVFEPYMPSLSAKVLSQLNLQEHGRIPDTFTLDLPTGHTIGKPEPLFKKLLDSELDGFRVKFSGQKEGKKEPFPCDIRGAVIVSVDDHPNDANLYVIRVDLGKETRQVVGRLKATYKPEDLLKRKVLVLCNLPPVELQGVKSEGMLLVADGKNKNKEVIQRLLQTDVDVPNWAGIQVEAEGTQFDTKPIGLKEFQKLDLKIGKDGKATFKQKFALLTQTAQPQFVVSQGAEPGAKIK